MKVIVTESPIDHWQELHAYEQGLAMHGKFGATAVFIGSMRDFNEGDVVTGMELEHYPGMTEKYLEKLCEQAADRWDVLDALIVHRVGKVEPSDTIVLVSVWSAHRADAFEVCRFLMEDLKSRAPFWKKENLVEGSRWVESNTPGETGKDKGSF